MTASERRAAGAGDLQPASSGRPGKNTCRRAVIGNVCDTAARTPVVIIGAEGDVKRHIALVTVAQTAPAAALATAIVVRDHVIEAVRRMVTGTDPGDGRLHGSRRAGCRGTSATAAQVA